METTHRDLVVGEPLGLTSEQAAARSASGGGNVLPQRRRIGLGRRVLLQVRDPMVVVLLVAAGLTIVTGDWTDAAVIMLVIVVNTTVGVAQEVKADRAISALSAMTAPEARVVRDGRQQLVPAADVVVDDLLVLAEGDIVPADASVVSSSALLVDESALTGESVPVDKAPAGLGESGDLVSAGTVVVRGRGQARVTAIGAASAMGRVAALMATGPVLTPLQRRLVGVGRVLAGAAVVLCTVVAVLGLAQGRPVELMLVTAISLVVAAVPESLPAVVTLALALGARRMAARNALIRRLPAVETLGSVTVLATDKTGTLTDGVMFASRLWTPQREVTLDGAGYSPSGSIREGEEILTAGAAPEVAALLTAAALCNDAALRGPEAGDDGWTAVGDPTEAALLAAAAKLGLDQDDLVRQWPRTDELGFDSVRKRMTTVHALPGGRVRIVGKGAPEAMLDAGVLETDADVIARASRWCEERAAEGYRVLAVAQSDQDRSVAPDTWEHGLHLLGLVALSDPPRRAAAATIAASQAAGIALVLITGDHPATARAIAVELGIIAADDLVVDCGTLAGRDDPRLSAARVYARATPEQKLDIIQAHRDAGEVVAMTGDGVNDGPALHRADIGIAMGRRGTEVARQAADLILADDDLATVVAAAEEGRRVYANIRRFLLYGLAGGSAEIVVMLLGPLIGLPLPLLPAQILWVNLLTHGLPGVALGSEPADPDAMRRPPRPPDESVLGAGLWQRILRVGLVIAAVTLGVAYWAHEAGHPWQSMAFVALGATQLAAAIGSRARPGTWANPMLLVAVVAALALQLAGVYLPPLQQLLGTESLPLSDLLVVAALSTLGYVAIRLDRVLHPRASAVRSG